ncbi:hypothetical protein EPUL_005947 [Erysiphe pulchra]|uniref:Uncharacterized protein n=1 Tax=Erysiphe pulchra TaxID=225359 RepID=A0A2S4PMV0_9PEZI|nr:hypothetical protein EPUL_005947 [Erysiphe pulchra]
MQSYPRFVFTILILSGLISALPKIDRLERRTNTISLQNRELHSEWSISTSSPHQRKRSIFKNVKRARTTKYGVPCDGTIYKQSRVDAIAAKACNQAYNSGRGSLRGALANMFRPSAKPFTGSPDLFPGKRFLNMRSITQGFFTLNQLKRIFGGGKSDYMVFSGQCTPVGIVRQTRGQMSVCATFSDSGVISTGGSTASSPTRPNVANQSPRLNGAYFG